MGPRLRRLALVVHVITSVGFLGAVACFLALAITGLWSRDGLTIQAAYLAMPPLTWFVIVPLSFAAPLTGLASSLGTSWGLFRYYWVLVKLLITVPSTAILLVHTRPINTMAAIAATAPVSYGGHLNLQLQLVVAAAAAMLALIVTTILSYYKPRGLTRYGWRKQQERNPPQP